MEKELIKLKQKESLLKEALYEAMGSLNDVRINALNILGVVLKKGKYDADIYLDPTGFDVQEQKESLRALKKAEGLIKRQVLTSTDWFKCPSLHFKFDSSMGQANRLDAIFDKIKKDESDV